MQDEAEQKAKIDREQANELEYVDESQKSEATESANASSGSAGAKPVRNPEREKPKWEDTITNRMLHWSYTPEQKEELKMAFGTTHEYSRWFYISRPVIWKSLFRSAFVHTES